MENVPTKIEWPLTMAADLHDLRLFEPSGSHVHAPEFTGLSGANFIHAHAAVMPLELKTAAARRQAEAIFTRPLGT